VQIQAKIGSIFMIVVENRVVITRIWQTLEPLWFQQEPYLYLCCSVV